MVEPFAWSSGMAIVLIANPSRQPLCNGLVEGAGKGFYLFCKLVQPSPSSLQLPSLLHCHRSCRPHHRPHPCPPPSLPSPLPSLLPLLLLARQPCHRLHCLAALTLLVACHPHCRHSCRTAITLIVARPAPSLPLPLLLPPLPSPSSLLATLVAVVIALFVASAFTRPPPLSPLRRLGWGREGPYQSGARSYLGRHCWCRHHHHRLNRPRDWPGGAGPTMHGIPTPGRQLAPMGGGCCQCPCSRCYPPCRLTAVAVAAACQRWRRRRCWQRSNKVNKDNDNNMTTTQQPTQQQTRQPTQRGDNWVAREKLCSKLCFILCLAMSQPLDSATLGRPPKVPFFGAGKLCFYVFMWNKMSL